MMRITILLPLLLLGATAPDYDHDGIPDTLDKCVMDSRNALPNQACDSDGDGYGNVCDADFDQSNNVTTNDFANYFLPAFKGFLKPTRGQDMDCNGGVNTVDFTKYFVPKFRGGMGGAIPGPSQCTPR